MDERDQESQRGDQPDSEAVERPWIALTTTYDVEAWIDSYNRELRWHVGQSDTSWSARSKAMGSGICFRLAHGGDIYLHTTEGGEVWLDVTPEAHWATPVIEAATGFEPPPGQVWHLPGDKLTQLVLGLSSLIGSTRLVRRHDYGMRKY